MKKESKNNSIFLSKAKTNKKDEFYTQYDDIAKEMEAYIAFDSTLFFDKTILLPCDNPQSSNFTKYFVNNFERLGLKKLISSCFNENSNGEVLIVTKHKKIQKKLKGNGDFRSEEIITFRNESDFVITNPPFSLFREFLQWIIQANKSFSIIGNLNALSCKNIFPLFQQNRIWLGATIYSGDREFEVPQEYPLESVGFRVDDDGKRYIRVKGVRWFCNIEHNRRYSTLKMNTMSKNIDDNPILVSKLAYHTYDNYEAIEIPQTSAIPSDYNGVMGVPISFLDKHNPLQFEILGIDFFVKNGILGSLAKKDYNGKMDRAYLKGKRLYSRIFIKLKGGNPKNECELF